MTFSCRTLFDYEYLPINIERQSRSNIDSLDAWKLLASEKARKGSETSPPNWLG